METILNGEIGTGITLKSFSKGDSFLINSYGGDLYEGLAIYDLVKGSGLEVGCIGVCASAATLALLASPNSWGTPNSRYLIHNPGATIEGTSSDMQRASKELAKEQLRALDLYTEHLKISRESIQELMNEEIFITAKHALQIGLIKSIKEYSKTAKVKPNADMKYMYNQILMCTKMEVNATKEDISKLEKLIMSVKDLFKPVPKMVVLTTSDGVSLDFGETAEEQIAPGVTATVDGNPAEGEYVMPDGRTFVFVGGELTEIMEAASTDPMAQENAELKAKVEELEAANTAMKTELDSKVEMIAKTKGEFDKIVMEFNGFKTKFSVNKPIVNTPSTVVSDKKKKFNYKK